MNRCKWCNLNNPLYVEYHDKEWGVLNTNDKYLFEMLILESFQAGLSWECILNKRKAFREAYDNFDIDKICNYNEDKIKELEENKTIELDFEYKDKIKTYLDMKKEMKAFENKIQELENQIKFEIGDAEYAYAPGYSLSWKKVSSNRVDSKKLKADYPEIYEKVIKKSSSRKFNIKEDK